MPTPSEALAHGVVALTPQEAVMKAADAYPDGVVGVFDFVVRRSDRVGSDWFLDSEGDYRDQRNIAVRIGPAAMAELRARCGRHLSGLLGHEVRVLGPAMRVRVELISDGHLTGKYYYQTQVPVRDARAIELVG